MRRRGRACRGEFVAACNAATAAVVCINLRRFKNRLALAAYPAGSGDPISQADFAQMNLSVGVKRSRRRKDCQCRHTLSRQDKHMALDLNSPKTRAKGKTRAIGIGQFETPMRITPRLRDSQQGQVDANHRQFGRSSRTKTEFPETRVGTGPESREGTGRFRWSRGARSWRVARRGIRRLTS